MLLEAPLPLERITSHLDPSEVPRLVAGSALRLLLSAPVEEHKPEGKGEAGPQLEDGENPMGSSIEALALLAAIKEMPRPVLTASLGDAHTLDHTSTVSALMDGRLFLPVMSAADESAQMGQAGTFMQPDGSMRLYPPCRAGVRCVGYTGDIRVQHAATAGGGSERKRGTFTGAVLQQMLYPAQFGEFERTGVWAAAKNRWCVLCYRSNMTAVVCSRRGDPDAARLDKDVILQYWTTIPDGPGNYASQHVLKRIPGVPDGLVGAMPMHRPQLCVWKCVPSTGRWMVDQSAMMWQPPPLATPRLGERLSDF
jgi:hypothetical protein